VTHKVSPRSPRCLSSVWQVSVRLSEQAAAVIYNSTRFEQTQHESHTDPLTALPNRRALDRQFEIGMARAAESRTSASVVVLDLDRLIFRR
jgi:GGDEF domain-containing protein